MLWISTLFTFFRLLVPWTRTVTMNRWWLLVVFSFEFRISSHCSRRLTRFGFFGLFLNFGNFDFGFFWFFRFFWFFGSFGRRFLFDRHERKRLVSEMVIFKRWFQWWYSINHIDSSDSKTLYNNSTNTGRLIRTHHRLASRSRCRHRRCSSLSVCNSLSFRLKINLLFSFIRVHEPFPEIVDVLFRHDIFIQQIIQNVVQILLFFPANVLFPRV